MHSGPNVKIFLIGNKCDLNLKRVVSFEQGELLKKKNNLEYFEETSALTGFNAEKVIIIQILII